MFAKIHPLIHTSKGDPENALPSPNVPSSCHTETGGRACGGRVNGEVNSEGLKGGRVNELWSHT